MGRIIKKNAKISEKRFEKLAKSRYIKACSLITPDKTGKSDMLGWRNWQTRMVEVHMEQSLGVQVPPRVPFYE